MDALSDPNVNRIGVYGMGGAGKSTLAKEVHKKALEGNLFDVVARLDLPEKPDLKAIQTRIAEVLGLEFREETVDGRADRLRQRLMMESRVLIILDNLWEKIDLDILGIPLTNEKSVKGRGAHSEREGFQEPSERKENYRKECKLLMTSRHQQLLTHDMEVQKEVKLDVLDEEESYTLFERMVGGIRNSRLQPMANKVARKCAGLPLLLYTLARILHDGDFELWKDTLNRMSTFEDEEIQKKVYSILALSYDHLPTEEVKSFFLLFGLFTNPDISILDLLKYSMGLGLLKCVHKMEAARSRVHQLIVKLKASCLLSDSETDGCVKIHDVVQDVAASIASRTQLAFKKAGATAEELQRIDIKSCTRILLEDCDVFDFPTMMFRCPEIVFFSLSLKDRSFNIPDSAFEGMTKLQVLNFTDMHFSFLPPSLVSLTSLYTLCLDFCRLEDISVITQLKNLEILSLRGSQIVDLPRDLVQLSRLKMLDLSNCSKLQFIPENVLSQLSLLEELLIGNSFVSWEVKCFDNQSNASLTELEHLSCLTNLEIHVPDAKKLPMRLFSKGLERYKIFIGDKWRWYGKYQTSKTLKLKLYTSIHWKHGVKTLLKEVEDLYLDEMKGIANVHYDLDIEGFQQLKHLHVQNSEEIRHIMDSQRPVHRGTFPVLESLILHNLVNLDKICPGNLMAEDFCKLSIVRVTSCDRLKNLFPLPMVRRNLQQLRELEIMGCRDMEVIFVDETEEGEDKNEAVEFTQLNSLKLGRLPQLRSFCSKVRESPASTSTSHWRRQNQSASDAPFMFNGKIVFPNLKEMFLSSINVDKMWDDQFADSSRKLTSLTVEACRNLNYLFTSSTVKNLALLQKLEIRDCNLMEDVIATEGEIIGKAAFPYLEFLKLEGLPKLSTFCTGELIKFPNLKELWIKDCPELRAFVSDPVAVNTGSKLALFDEKVAFPKLEKLWIFNMDALKMIWHTELHECSFRKLKSMIVERTKELLNIFPSDMLMRRLLNLENLELNNCALLEEVFNLQLQASINSTTQGLPASRLRTLRIRNMPNLKLIWNKHPHEREIISFNDLQVVEAYACPNLKSVFPAIIARGPLQLEYVGIGFCEIEKIVERDEGTEAIARFEFPKLTTLRLHSLWELKTLYPGMHTCEWPMLKTLDVRDCPNIELFTSESGSVQDNCRRSQLDNPLQQPFFSVEKVISNLEELTLTIRAARMIQDAQMPASFFDEVRYLRLEGSNEKSASFSFDLLQRFHNLETLEIIDNGLKEMFSCNGSVGGENQGSIVARIRLMRLLDLINLKSIWRGDCQPERTFEHIETLQVFACNSLISLGPSIASVGNLSRLDVFHCDGLLNLVTSSTAQSMRHLTTLCISYCGMVEEIVAREEDDREDQITWYNLKSLELRCLGSLTCFSSAYYTFQFPSLEEVIVTQCPRMKTFSGGVSITPKLKRVKRERRDAEGQWEGDLNTTIQKLCAEVAG